MLRNLLRARLEAAGVQVSEVASAFEFNRSYYEFAVSELALALESIKLELEKLWLLESAQIAWHDPREYVWRVSHSKSGCFEAPSNEEWAEDTELLARLRSIFEQNQGSRDESSGQ